MNEKNFSDGQELAAKIFPSDGEPAENMPGGFFIYRADSNEDILYANDVMLDIFGCETLEEFKELTGYTFRGMVHPDDLPEVEKSITEQIERNAKHLDYVEYRIKRRDGKIRRVDDWGRFVHTKNHGDVYYVFIRDITDQHAAREESRRRAKVIEGLSVGFSSIYLLDLKSGSLRPYRLEQKYFQSITEKLSANEDGEYNLHEVLTAYAEKYIVHGDRDRYLTETDAEKIHSRLKDEKSYTVNYRCFGEGDKEIYMEMSIMRIDEDEFHNYAVMGYRDITEQVASMQKELADKLKMEMDLEREKHANEIKAAFLFSISHDIRTPMNAIMGFTNLAKRNVNNPAKLENYLAKVDESNRHLMALIDDLLEMSKIDYGRIELKAESCKLNEQLQIVLDMFRPLIEEKKILLDEKIDLPEEEVRIDSLRFRRIMGNLVSNAVKFTAEQGNIKISARRKQVSKSGYARYEFSVSDNGMGMTEDFMRRMFEAFEREENSTKSGYIGTGLGLTITKKLLDIMGGSITVKSKRGEGSTFTIDLPLKLADHIWDEKNIAVEEPQYKSNGEHRILLVEDIEVNRLLAETILTDAGFIVESVPDGCDAVEAVNNKPEWYYDLVLMDIQMPVMNGYEATRSIRALSREDTKNLPIIALSANARDEDKKMSMESGMNSHVAKPFDIANLIDTISEHISQRK